MNIDKKYIDYTIKTLIELLKIHSPSGYTKEIESKTIELVKELGLEAKKNKKGNVIFELGGEGNPLILMAHLDTLGLMVRSIKSNGRIRFIPISDYSSIFVATENVTIFTRDNKQYSGTVQPVKSSVHVWGNVDKIVKNEEDMEIVLDEPVKTAEDVRALGIESGDIISYDCRTKITKSEYIKSRHLDDKISCAILLGLAKIISNNNIKLNRKVSIMFSVHEEVGHGGATGITEETNEVIAVDMGVVGDDLTCDEHMVSICAKSNSGPYNYDLVSELIKSAKATNADYSVDVYPKYGSDVDVSVKAGYDIVHGLLGPGISASHGYERGHIDGISNTLKVLYKYVTKY